MIRKILTVAMAVSIIAVMFFQVPVAAQYELKEITPDVKAALDGRRARFEQLSALKAKGFIGENNRGYVEVLQESEDVAAVADDENNDRKVIYLAIAQQNNIENELKIIEEVFAQVQREKAVSGEMIQSEDGEWISK